MEKPTSASTNKSSDFDDWRPTNQSLVNGNCDRCHYGVVLGSGNLLLEITPSFLFTNTTGAEIMFKVENFAEAGGSKITVGLNNLDEDNQLFLRDGVTDYVDGIGVGSSGNSGTYSIDLTMPSSQGNYSLLAYAVWGYEDTPMYYLEQSINVSVHESLQETSATASSTTTTQEETDETTDSTTTEESVGESTVFSSSSQKIDDSSVTTTSMPFFPALIFLTLIAFLRYHKSTLRRD